MLAALLTTSQFPRIHFDVWIMEESRLHTHTHALKAIVFIQQLGSGV